MRLSFLFVCIAGLTSGCGMFLDLEPADDGGVGMDGRVRPACAEDSDCDDGRVCNGIEVCANGVCAAGTELDCDDGIDCTENRCRESAGGCVAVPRDDQCPEVSAGCRSAYCDVDLGCRTFSDDARCDDELDCTIDSCVDSTCSFTPDHERCADGYYCNGGGCQPLPTYCTTSSECIALSCNDVSCTSGRCEYSAIATDTGCTAEDECLPAACEEGRCVFGDPMDCERDDPARCVSEACVRDDEGEVSCVATPRTGRCGTADCSAGTCSDTGLCEEASLCIATSDRCVVAICSGGGCTPTPITCGANARCRSATGTCRCNPGFAPCATDDGDCCAATTDGGPIMDAGSDAGSDAGLDSGVVPSDAGTDGGGYDGGAAPDDAAVSVCVGGISADCDLSGDCECDLRVSRCSVRACVCQSPCGAGKICCPGGVHCALAADCPAIDP